jgi:hypothetical protein
MNKKLINANKDRVPKKPIPKLGVTYGASQNRNMIFEPDGFCTIFHISLEVHLLKLKIMN